MSENEIALAGGRTTSGVVRVGETIRRPPGVNAGFVRSLLRHLESAGFDGTPRYLGIDENGRETYSYLSGDVPNELGNYSDETLQDAAQLIRRYHDTTSALFETTSSHKAGIEVACHNDLSPCNTVFQDSRPYALIDFDAAAPGSRAYDLGYATWLWLDIGDQGYSPSEQNRRLQLFLSAYGSDLVCENIVLTMLDRQAIIIAEAMRTGNDGMADWAEDSRRWILQHWSPLRTSGLVIDTAGDRGQSRHPSFPLPVQLLCHPTKASRRKTPHSHREQRRRAMGRNEAIAVASQSTFVGEAAQPAWPIAAPTRDPAFVAAR